MVNSISLKTHFEEDLATLSDIFIGRKPLPPRLVRGCASAIVRKWLIDGELNKLAHELSVEFTLPALETSAVFTALSNAPEIKFFLAGGILLGGIPIRSIYMSSSPSSSQAPIPLETHVSLYTPKKYLSSKRVFFENQAFSTEQIIRYVANKHGGVHLDSRREQPWQDSLERASNYMTFGNPDNESEPRVLELDEFGGSCMVVIPLEVGNKWSCLEIEMLSTAQALLNVHCNGHRLIITE